MKGVLAWGLTLALLAGVLAGCGPAVKEASSKPGEEIVIGMAIDLSAGTASYGLAA